MSCAIGTELVLFSSEFNGPLSWTIEFSHARRLEILGDKHKRFGHEDDTKHDANSSGWNHHHHHHHSNNHISTATSNMDIVNNNYNGDNDNDDDPVPVPISSESLRGTSAWSRRRLRLGAEHQRS